MKNKKQVFFSLIAIFIVCLFSILKKEIISINAISTPETKNIKSDSEMFKQKEIKNVLNRSYYHYQKPSIFSSSALNNDPSLYQMYWVTKLINVISYNSFENGEKWLETTSKENPSTNDINNLIYRSYLLSLSPEKKGENDNTMELIKNKNYDETQNLFFLKSRTDTLLEKLSITRSVTEILVMYDDKKYKEQLKNKLINLFNEDKFYSNSVDSLTSEGGQIILCLYNLGFKYDDIKNQLKDRTDWVNYINIQGEKNFTESKVDQNSIFILDLLVRINLFFGKESTINLDSLNNIMSYWIEDYNGKTNFIFPDAQFIYTFSYIYKYLNIDNPYIKEIKNYIEDHVNSGFIKVSYNVPNIQDNYYGVYLANRYDYTYDVQGIKSTVMEWYVDYVEEKSEINDYDEFNNIYYLVLTMKELQMNNINNTKIINLLNDYLNQITFETSGSKLQLKQFSDAIRLIKILDGNISKENLNKYHELVKYLEEKTPIYQTIESTRLESYLLYNSDEKMEMKIKNSLDLLYSDGAYKANIKSKTPNLQSTYMGVLYKLKNGTLTEQETKKIKSYLRKTIIPSNIKGLDTKNEPLHLSTLYYIDVLFDALNKR